MVHKNCARTHVNLITINHRSRARDLLCSPVTPLLPPPLHSFAYSRSRGASLAPRESSLCGHQAEGRGARSGPKIIFFEISPLFFHSWPSRARVLSTKATLSTFGFFDARVNDSLIYHTSFVNVAPSRENLYRTTR